MKLRSISLSNVRRFAGKTATIHGLGDGISVVAQPNEFGKSTFFDALHAVFFIPYGSRNREIQSLQSQPAGGKVEIRVDIDLPQGTFRIEKRFLSRPMARVTDIARGTIVAQDDEAERWIREMSTNGLSGPAGLLWVRQGVTRLEGEDRGENAKALTERRNLLSAVAGEIDVMTGGRRMDRVVDRATEELGRLASATGRPKAGGPWKAAKDEVERLTAEAARLATTCRDLSDALARRHEIEERLTQLDHPDRRTARVAALRSAEMALMVAEAHAARLSELRQAVEIARLQKTDQFQRLAALEHAIAAVARAQRAVDTAAAQEGALTERIAAAAEAESVAVAQLSHIAGQVQTLRDEVSRQRRQSAAKAARSRLAEVSDRLAHAEAHRARIEAAEAAIAGNPITDNDVARIDEAQRQLAGAEAAAMVTSVTVTLRYNGDTRVLQDGAPLAEGTTVVDGTTEFTLPGIGQMVIGTGMASGHAARDARSRAADMLGRALSVVGQPSAEAAHAALRARQTAEQDQTLAKALLKALAPDGLPALRALWSATQAEAEAAEPEEAAPVDLTELEATLSQREAEIEPCRLTADAARATVSRLATEHAVARAGRMAAVAAWTEAQTTAGDPATQRERLDLARSAASAADATLREAEGRCQALAAEAPDLATARAELARARGVVTGIEKDIESLRMDRARLEGEIGKQADLGVEEKLAETEDALQAAIDREARYAAEVAALLHLLEVLDATRTAARDAYFGPVQRELQPLLAILAQDAALSFDDGSLLPGALSRRGATEPVDTLSGGTQEQIAILTRLAFARLFARAGRPVPVILDDALVHTDDDRIRRMFIALHRVAADQQIIVFTCRQMAFQDLGGTRPEIDISDLA